MSVSVALPTSITFDWKPISLVFAYKNIFRTMNYAGFLALVAPAAKIAAEAITLLAIFAGIFSLFLGLSVI